MFGLFDFSKIFDTFNLSKIVNSVFMNSYTSFKDMTKKIIPDNSVINVLNPSLGLAPPEITPETSGFASRIALRSLAGLPPIAPAQKTNTIEQLSGSISWLSKEKIDVTEVIRELRDC